MDYEEVMTTLQSMKSRFNDGFSTLDRSYLDRLHYDIFGKDITNRGCSDCYRDAFILIINYLKKNKAMPQKCNYRLKPGAVIQFFGKSAIYSNPNLTDEIAEKFLGMNSDNKRMFSDLPSDWEARVASRKAGIAEQESVPSNEVLSSLTDKLTTTESQLAEATAKNDSLIKINKDLSEKNVALTKENEVITAKNDELTSEIERMKSETPAPSADSAESGEDSQEIANLNLELENLRVESETLAGENESLKAEITKLKNENRALKSANTRLKNGEAVAE